MRDPKPPRTSSAERTLRLVPPGSDEGGGDERSGGSDGSDLHLVAQYLDGLLDEDREAAFLEHLLSCEPCERALHAELQIRDREDTLRQAAREHASSHPMSRPARLTLPRLVPTEELAGATAALAAQPTPATDAAAAPVVAIGTARRARRLATRWVPLASLLAAAAAAVLLVMPHRQQERVAPKIALAETRSLEARLSWGPAAKFRAYDTARSQTASRAERLDAEVLAALTRAGDCAGLAAMYQLYGAFDLAEQTYAEPGCADTADLNADRAALAVARGKPELALALADKALIQSPDHPAALWNRALALRDLDARLAAAAVFARVAKLDVDAGWADEARRNAKEARRIADLAEENLKELTKTGKAMAEGGAVISTKLVRAMPGRARLRFHEAVRTATTAARLDQLEPLARELEGLAGRDLHRYLREARANLSAARTALVPFYVELLRSTDKLADDKRWPGWKARAKAAGSSDLLLGAQLAAFGDAPETLRLATATGDPWFIGLAEVEAFKATLEGDRVAAERHLEALEALCEAGAPRAICLRAAIKRAEFSMDLGQPAPALVAARKAFADATAEGEVAWRALAAFYLAEAERLRGNASVARAYYEERALADPSCGTQQQTTATLALMELEQGRLPQAKALAKQLSSCEVPPGRTQLALHVDMMEAGLPIDRASWRAAQREAVKHLTRNETDRAYLEYLGLREQLNDETSGEPEQAQVRGNLTEVAQRARALDNDMGRRTRIEAERTLFSDACRRGAWAEALEMAAQSHALPRPERCALALVSRPYQLAAVLVRADGQLDGEYQAEPGWRLPGAWQDELQGCEEISIIAFPPWPAEPPMRPNLPWRFALERSPTDSAAPLAGSARTVIIANTTPPRSLQLAPLPPLQVPAAGATLLDGPQATVERIRAEAKDATLLEFHVHSTRVASSDAPVLALSESASGWALTAEEIAGWRLDGDPVVLLADCQGAVPAGYDHVMWGLPTAFRRAGARAVVAALTDIPDAEGGQVFAEIREALRHDDNVARVVSRIRAEKIAADPASWVRSIVVFE